MINNLRQSDNIEYREKKQKNIYMKKKTKNNKTYKQKVQKLKLKVSSLKK